MRRSNCVIVGTVLLCDVVFLVYAWRHAPTPGNSPSPVPQGMTSAAPALAPPAVLTGTPPRSADMQKKYNLQRVSAHESE